MQSFNHARRGCKSRPQHRFGGPRPRSELDDADSIQMLPAPAEVSDPDGPTVWPQAKLHRQLLQLKKGEKSERKGGERVEEEG